MTTTIEAPVTTRASSAALTSSSPGRRVAMLLLAVAIVAACGWAVTSLADAHDGDGARLHAIRIGLVAVWGLVGVALGFRRPQEPLGLVVLAGTLVGAAAVAAAGALLAKTGGTAAELVRALAVGALPAVVATPPSSPRKSS